MPAQDNENPLKQRARDSQCLCACDSSSVMHTEMYGSKITECSSLEQSGTAVIPADKLHSRFQTVEHAEKYDLW